MNTKEYVKEIRAKLEKLEQEKNVIILFAAVCGSRAYGLNHPNSDCDTHFVFVYPMDKYLNVTQPSDYINLGEDVNGYELRKFLGIVRKSGFNAAELINSPFNIMGDNQDGTAVLKELISECLNPKRLIQAFCGCSHNAFSRFNVALKEGDKAAMVKQIVCATRMFFSAEYIYNQADMDSVAYPPLNFDELVANTKHVFSMRGNLLNNLLNYAELKRQGSAAADALNIEECKASMELLKEKVESLNALADNVKSFKLPDDIEERMNRYFKSQLFSRYI